MIFGNQKKSKAANQRESRNTPGIHRLFCFRHLLLHQTTQFLGQFPHFGWMIFETFVKRSWSGLRLLRSRRSLLGWNGHSRRSCCRGKSTSSERESLRALTDLPRQQERRE